MERSNHKTKRVSHGGIKCNCCMPHETVKRSRIYLNRVTRRTERAKLRTMRAAYCQSMEVLD